MDSPRVLKLLKEVPLRIQIILDGVLIAEAVVQGDAEASKLWSRWAISRYKKNKSFGCSTVRRADLPRFWNVPVGSRVE